MITIENITMLQVLALGTEAAQAGDSDMVADCAALESAYCDSDASELSAMLDEERGEIRDAARRIVAAISDAEAAAL